MVQLPKQSANSTFSLLLYLQVFDLGGEKSIVANAASQFVIGSQTLEPGGAAVTAEGTSFSLAASASAIIINGHTSALYPSQVLATIAPPLITIGPSSLALTANSQSNYIFGSQILPPGGPAITAFGTRYTLAEGATDLIVGSSTEQLSPQYLALLSTKFPLLTLGSQNISAIPRNDEYVIGTQALNPGTELDCLRYIAQPRFWR